MLRSCHMGWMVEMTDSNINDLRELYDYRIDHVRLKMICIDNITPYLLNLGLSTLNDGLWLN